MLLAIKKIDSVIIAICDTPRPTREEREFINNFSLVLHNNTEVTLLDFYNLIESSKTYTAKAKRIAKEFANTHEYFKGV